MHTAANRKPFSPDDSRKIGIAFADLIEWLIGPTVDRPQISFQIKWRNAMLPSTVDRVPEHTSEAINEQIRRQIEECVVRYQNASDDEIEERLEELDREWDIERLLEANAATACLVGLTLGATVDRKWFLFPAVVAGFLLQHALQGWCPPLPVFRRMGVRTASEIDYERYALKALRGDFDKFCKAASKGERGNAAQSLQASTA
jgi:hypothetical protein